MNDKNKAPRPATPKISAADMIAASGLPVGSSSEGSDPKLRDKPAAIDPSAHKFDLEVLTTTDREHPVPAYEHLGELPSSYGTRKLYLTARDPHWLFCYWDLSFDQLIEAERSAHDSKVFLQVYLDNGSRIQQIHITPWSKEWMIHTNRPNTRFYAEIGYYRYDGNFEVISRSRLAKSPRDNLSENHHVTFATIPFKLSFFELRGLLDHLAREGEALSETLSRLQIEGYPLPFEHYRGEQLSEAERERFLAEMGADILKRSWIDSQEIIERITNRFQLNLNDSSGQWPPSSHWLAGSSMSSPFGGGSSRDFSMHVNAELIIYGGTEPDATLRIDGNEIQLDENGNFHFHFNFKDGKYHIPVEATSADGQEMRTALLSFLKLTAKGEDVKSTPQPDRDAPMGRVD